MKRGGRLPRTVFRDGKRVTSAAWHRVRVEVESRADSRCEARACDDCHGRGCQAHHILRRGQGGPDDPSNLLWVCSPCHLFIHGNPLLSYDRGWLRRSGMA